MSQESKATVFEQISEREQKHVNADASHEKRSGIPAVLRGILKLVLPFGVIAAGGFLTWQMVATKPDVNRRPPREQAYAVQVKVAQPQSYQPQITLFGTVSAARTLDMRALVSGEVIWVNPKLAAGEIIEASEEILRIDPFSYQGGVTEARANLSEAEAKLAASKVSLTSDEVALKRLEQQLTFAQNDFERAQTLAKSGNLTEQALEARELTLSQRQQSVETKRFNLELLASQITQQEANVDRLKWKLDQAERDLDHTTLRAPFTGLVQTVNVALGRSVSGSDTLVSMYDPDQMDVRFTLSDAQYGRLISDNSRLIGRDIKVVWKLGEFIKTHKATIARVTPEVDASYGGVEVYARLETGADLRTGTFVELQVPDKLYTNAISVPQAAIYNGDKVYINKDGRMAALPIKVLAYLGDTALLDATDFAPDTQIITTRVAEAGPGLKLVVPDFDTTKPTAEKPSQQKGAGKQPPEGKRPPDGKKPNGQKRPDNDANAQGASQ